MAFRKKGNSHDYWRASCETHRNDILATGLPPEVFRREDILEAFLEHGNFCGRSGEVTLMTMLSDDAFIALEKIVNSCLDSHEGYPALQQERFRRFQRYG